MKQKDFCLSLLKGNLAKTKYHSNPNPVYNSKPKPDANV